MTALNEAIKAHALAALPHEACGVVLNEQGTLTALPTANIATQPTDYFEIPATDYLKHRASGKLAGYYHSHPTTPAEFSEADKSASERARLPAYLYSVLTDAFACYEPNGYVAPLEGRTFELGSHDCVGLVMDYYRTVLRIPLDDFPRSSRFIVDGFADIGAYARRNSLQRVTVPLLNDIVIMRVGHSGQHANHAGVLVAPDVMLHQLINQRSARVVYGGYWKAVTRLILRHKSLT